MLEVSQSGIDLVNSGVDSDETKVITALLNRTDPLSAKDALNTLQGMGISQEQSGVVLNHLLQRGYLTNYQDNPGSAPTQRKPVLTEEGVPSVLPTSTQTSAAEGGRSVPSVLPQKPGDQTATRNRFRQLLTPRGLKA